MGGKNKGGNEAAQARADEQQRQQRIREGTARIDEIFGGKMVGSGAVGADAAFNPSGTYYMADGSVWKPKTYSMPTTTTSNSATGDGTAPNYIRPTNMNQDGALSAAFRSGEGGAVGTDFSTLTPEEQFREALRGGLYTGTAKTGGFGDEFFDSRKKAFLDYATPQLDDQYADANKALTYQLARQGLLDSSIRADKGAELQKKYDLNKQQIADQALSYSTEARNNVEKARSDLIAMLNATGDAEGAANSALARSQALSQPQAFNPLTQLFADFTSGLGQQAQWERNAMMGGAGGRYNTGLFSNSKSVKVS
jgi:hypothetical protein